MLESSKFQNLFKKYRLKAEISTLSELGRLLTQKGLVYEDSIFSHWQKGTRVPQNRHTLLKLLEIFVERKAITTLSQANEFLESAGTGYLTEKEAKKIQFNNLEQVPFQVPNQIDNFTGRKEQIMEISKEVFGNILVIHGTAGVGKSVLAIRLGYLLKDKFPDGVLWYRLDTSDVMDILLSIAFAFGKDISYIQDKEIRASTVRSLLADKKVLLIFDNVETNTDVRSLLPNALNCSVIITSRSARLPIPTAYKNITLEAFNKNETIALFTNILGSSYVSRNNSDILCLAEMMGNFPLALHIFAKGIKRGSLTITELIKVIEQDLLPLEELLYEDRNLFIAIDVSYNLLDFTTKRVFNSLAVFDGKDFSIEPVAFINDKSNLEIKKILDNLKNVSLIEQSTKGRYRIHPIIKKYIKKKLTNPILFSKAAQYYIKSLAPVNKQTLKTYPNLKQESDNVLYIFKKCYEFHFWDKVIDLWNPLETLLYATHQLNKMRYLFQIVKSQKTGINIYQRIELVFFCILVVCWILLYLSGLKISYWNYMYSFLFGLVPLIGGVIGFFIAKSWGFLKSSIGKAILFLSGGLFFWGMGGLIWGYYNFFQNIPVPYPSLADLGFMPSYLLWTIGMVYLPHAIGGKFGFKKWHGKPFIILIPVFVLALSYYLLIFTTKTTLVFAPPPSYTKLFLDILYPVGDVVILTTALIVGTSFKFFGGKYKLSIYAFLLGFCFQYIGDFLFSYTTTTGTYYTGGIPDLFFTIGLSLLTFGLLGFYFPPNPSKKIKDLTTI